MKEAFWEGVSKPSGSTDIDSAGDRREAVDLGGAKGIWIVGGSETGSERLGGPGRSDRSCG